MELDALAAEARARGISYGQLAASTTAQEQKEIVEAWAAKREARIKAERAADGGGDGSHVQHMLHAGADMVIGGGEEDLRLMLEPPEGR